MGNTHGLSTMNKAILKRLKTNSRMSWQQIGKEVYLTGQAVAARVQQMEEQGIINGYTVRQNDVPRHFIDVFMNDSRFGELEAFLNQDERVEHAYKVTGGACYHVVFVSEKDDDLEQFLNQLLPFARYQVSSAIRCVK